MDGPQQRPRTSVFIAQSLDGYIARADGSIDFLSSVERPGEDYGYAAFFAAIDGLVIGRKTYDTVLGFDAWPYGSKRCVVLTHRTPASARAGEEFFSGTPQALLERLGRDEVRHVYIDGGNVIQQFLAASLIDDLTISVIPITLGGGVRLFVDTGVEQRLSLEESLSFPSGLVQLRYRVER
jgi:dihydrofolate reductase